MTLLRVLAIAIALIGVASVAATFAARAERKPPPR